MVEEQGHGASASQTGPSQAEPEVSALRASVPCAVICSFCLKPNNEVEWMVTSWDVAAAMCSECVSSAQAIIQRQRQIATNITLLARASGIEARSDETPAAAQPEGQEPDPKGDAQPSSPTPDSL